MAATEHAPDPHGAPCHGDSPPVAVLGGGSLVTTALVRQLGTRAAAGEIFSRRSRPDDVPGDGPAWRRRDVTAEPAWQAPAGGLIISLLPLPVLATLLPRLNGAGQLVALGSTALRAWANSSDAKERLTAARLAEAEAAVAEACTRLGIAWTILRPTMIYGEGRDRNVASIARVIRRFRAFPVAGRARGRRQPLHVDDLARAIVACIDNPRAAGRAFDLPGGETVTYRALVRRVFQAQHRRPLIVPLPGALLRLLVVLLNRVWRTGYSPALFARMNDDLVFDGEDAWRVLGIAPRRFSP